MVVSEYIDNPLLIDGLKFDLRIYAAITSVDPLRIYMYKEGLVRFATEKFSKKGTSRLMHLTNYSLNKFSEAFVSNTDAAHDDIGNKWSLTALKRLLKKHVGHRQNVEWNAVEANIKDIIVKTVISVEAQMYSSAQMHVPYKTNCFDLLGFDILIDDTLSTWLLEVNLSPSLNCDSPLDQKIKGEMLADLFTMLGIVPVERRRSSGSGYRSKAINGPAYLHKQLKSSGRSRLRSGWNESNKPQTAYQDFLTSEERAAIRETTEELERCGNFERIYPSETSVNYRTFFDEERKLNTLICSHVGRLHRKDQSVLRRTGRSASKPRCGDGQVSC
jgi:tubulin polyglutamylase TTLL5